MIILELSSFNMENLVKGYGTLSSLKIAITTLVVLMAILSNSSVHSVSIPTTTSNGRCSHFIQDKKMVVSCSSYTEIPTNITKSDTVWYLHMEQGNTINIVTNGSLIRSNLKSLEILNLNRCGIRVVEPGAFAGSSILMHIYLGRNLITVLNPDIFKDVPSLKIISMNNNSMYKVEQGKIFPIFTALLALDLSNCRLDAVPANVFDNLRNLISLNLTGNYLQRLDWRVFQRKTILTRLKLENNPWHCDCHIYFLMEILKNMSLAKVYENITCTSAEIPKWKGKLWNQVPEADMKCHPEINKFVYSSWLSQPNENINASENETLHLGQDVYFKCEYSGFPKPKVQWFKDNQLIMDNMNRSTLPSTNLAKIPLEKEFMNDASSTFQGLERDEDTFRYKFRDILKEHQVQVKDQGSYTCAVVQNHMAYHKTVTLPEIKIPRKAEGKTTWIIWKRIVISLGLLLSVFIAAILTFLWIKRSIRELRGIIQEPRINLEEIKSSNPYSLMTETHVDTSLI